MTHGSTGTAATALQVLVVDDSQAQRTRVRSALEGPGLTVVGEAEDGAQALSEAGASPRRGAHGPAHALDGRRPGHPDPAAAAARHTRGVVDWDDDAQLERAVCNSGAQVGILKDIGTVELVATLQDACTAQDEARPVAGGHWTVGPMHPLRGSPPPTGQPSSSSRSPTGMPYAGRSGARSAARWSTAGSSWWPPTMYC